MSLQQRTEGGPDTAVARLLLASGRLAVEDLQGALAAVREGEGQPNAKDLGSWNASAGCTLEIKRVGAAR